MKKVAIICAVSWVLWPILWFTPALDHIPLLPALIIGIVSIIIAIGLVIALVIMALINYARRPKGEC